MPYNNSTATMTTPASDPGRIAFIPLEANPELMTKLLHDLGLKSNIAVHDVYSLTEPELLAFIPRPAYALLLVFPVSAAYESARLAEDVTLSEYSGKGDNEPVVWFKQTIRNACGMMGLLHAVSNGPVRQSIGMRETVLLLPSYAARDCADYSSLARLEPDSALGKLLKEAIPLDPVARTKLLETSQSLAQAHHSAASQGDTAAPQATDEVDLHYVCFVKGDDGKLWELDGRRKGPLERGTLEEGEDVLSDKALTLGPKRFIERGGEDIRFNAVALAASMD